MSTTPGDVFSSLDTPSANSTTAGSSDALLASPDPFLRALDILQISISGVGVVINLATAVTLFRNGKGFSTKSRLLLQHQAVLDTTACGSSFVLLVQKPYYWRTGDLGFDTYVIWVSTYNLICIAFERHVALVYPIVYKKTTRRHIMTAFLVIYVFCAVCILPEAQFVRMTDGWCGSGYYIQPYEVGLLVDKIWATSAFFLFYLVPTSLMIYLYGRVICATRKTTGLTSSASDRLSAQLTRTSLAITTVYVVTQTWIYWYFTLGTLRVVPFVIGSALQKMNVLMGAINSAANPILYFAFMPTFRRSLSKTFVPCLLNRILPNHPESSTYHSHSLQHVTEGQPSAAATS